MIIKKLPIDILIPNNFYINRSKLENIKNAYYTNSTENLPPILVGIIGTEYALVDGHSRTMAAIENGETEILAEIYPIEEVDGPTELYIAIHNKAKDMKLTSVDKLKNRIISSNEHEISWVKYCEDLMDELGI